MSSKYEKQEESACLHVQTQEQQCIRNLLSSSSSLSSCSFSSLLTFNRLDILARMMKFCLPSSVCVPSTMLAVMGNCGGKGGREGGKGGRKGWREGGVIQIYII